jgi:hypothetical protein
MRKVDFNVAEFDTEAKVTNLLFLNVSLITGESEWNHKRYLNNRLKVNG